MNINAYRSHVGQVLPEQFPFEGTILENITFGNKAIAIDTVNQVVKDVGLQEFVRKQSKGINSEILSQGQSLPHTVCKRVLLARAIVHEPKILLLKDALEHFEPTEAKRLMNYLASPEKPWLLIVSGKNEDWKTVCNKNITFRIKLTDSTMLNISHNQLNKKVNLDRYSALAKAQKVKHNEYFNRFLLASAIIGIIILFLPWTQNVTGAGYVTTLTPDQRPQTIQSPIPGRD